MATKASYKGPGLYEVTVRVEGEYTIQVEAESRAEAEEIAVEEPVDVSDLDLSTEHIRCLQERSPITEAALIRDREPLTSLEDAFYAITGRIPAEAIARLRAAAMQEVAHG